MLVLTKQLGQQRIVSKTVWASITITMAILTCGTVSNFQSDVLSAYFVLKQARKPRSYASQNYDLLSDGGEVKSY